ncbi:MAG TPA: 5-formyltetrahydrofolate cyclo-ligase [Chitinophagaceae bacterium]|nr:5-formyltetrahydrofolate cyclo-ligase [Chitinophagaceae bacterium]
MTKKELRNIYKQKRTSIAAKDKLIWDDLLLIQFQKINLENIRTVFVYWPMENMNEPDTHAAIRYLQHMIPDLQLAYPVIHQNLTSEMKAVLTGDETDFFENSLGIIEPENGIEIDPTTIDLVLMPMLICDEAGNRIGFGKGYYDRFLIRCRKNVIKIAFSYFDPVDKIDDTNAFDVPLNFCITPRTIYEFE